MNTSTPNRTALAPDRTPLGPRTVQASDVKDRLRYLLTQLEGHRAALRALYGSLAYGEDGVAEDAAHMLDGLIVPALGESIAALEDVLASMAKPASSGAP